MASQAEVDANQRKLVNFVEDDLASSVSSESDATIINTILLRSGRAIQIISGITNKAPSVRNFVNKILT